MVLGYLKRLWQKVRGNGPEIDPENFTGDTREDNYCWLALDAEDGSITPLTMDASAAMYETGLGDQWEVRIVSWAESP